MIHTGIVTVIAVVVEVRTGNREVACTEAEAVVSKEITVEVVVVVVRAIAAIEGVVLAFVPFGP